MTQEQKEQLAKEYADSTTPFGDHGGNNWRVAYNSYLAALNAHDEEFALLRAEIEDDNAVMKQLKAELAKAKNPWVSVKDRLPKRPKSKYDYQNRFIVCREGDSPFVAIYHKNGKWYILDYMQYTEIVAPDYWMPMLQTPKGGEK